RRVISMAELKRITKSKQRADTLLAYFMRREQKSGIEILERFHGPKITRYRISLANARKHAPHLFEREHEGERVSLTRLARKLEQRIDGAIADVLRDRRILERLEALERNERARQLRERHYG